MKLDKELHIKLRKLLHSISVIENNFYTAIILCFFVVFGIPGIVAKIIDSSKIQKNHMALISDFPNMTDIPVAYTCNETNRLPPLVWLNVPDKAKSLTLIMTDPDTPKIWDHWLLFNIPAGISRISWQKDNYPPMIGIGKNSWGHNAYKGPCPPSGKHRYIFTLYALDNLLSIKTGATKAEIVENMKGHILAQTQLTGTYERIKRIN